MCKIRENVKPTEENSIDPTYIEEDYLTSYWLNSFKPLQDINVNRLRFKSETKGCELDHIHISFLKDNVDLVLPVVTAIINTFLQTGKFLQHLKIAIVRPLPKKTSLNSSTKTTG